MNILCDGDSMKNNLTENTHDSYSDVLKRLKQYRKKMKINQTSMGQKIGLTQSHYSKVERRDKIISHDALMKLDEHGLDMDFLITGIVAKKTVLDDLFWECPLKQRAVFLNLMFVYVNSALNTLGKQKILPCNREMAILEFHLTEKTDHHTDMIWKCIRDASGLTQERFAYELDMGLKSYREIENERTMPNAEILTILYERYGYYPSLVNKMNPNYLLMINEVWLEIPDNMQSEIEILLQSHLNFIAK